MRLGIIAILSFLSPAAFAVDKPHDVLLCTECHSLHQAPGPSLSSDSSNSNLCISCHNPGVGSTTHNFSDADQASPGVSGTSHRWDTMARIDPASCWPAVCGPDSRYGLRKPAADPANPQADEIQNYAVNLMLQQFNYVVTCSVCHNQHSQLLTPWDAWATSTQSQAGRHFMRVNNDIAGLCEDCHYYRSAWYTSSYDVRTWSGNRKSHPVGRGLGDVTNPKQFVGTVPLEPASALWSTQGGPQRFHINGAGDSNITNNIVLDSSGKIRCLSCHGMHYTDSWSSTVDSP